MSILNLHPFLDRKKHPKESKVLGKISPKCSTLPREAIKLSRLSTDADYDVYTELFKLLELYKIPSICASDPMVLKPLSPKDA